MTNLTISEFGTIVFTILLLASYLVLWGKLLQTNKAMKDLIESMKKVIYPDPGSKMRLMTALDCDERGSDCWKKITPAMKDISDEQDRQGEKLDFIEKQIIAGGLRTGELERLEKKTHEL